MSISAKTEYACIAVLELAASFSSDSPVRLRDIADEQGIPSRFLVQILLQLKAAGLVSSTRGAAGGYRLIRDPAELTLADVMAVIDGPSREIHTNATRSTPTSRALLSEWNRASQLHHDFLNNVTFAELVERSRDESGNMYYI